LLNQNLNVLPCFLDKTTDFLSSDFCQVGGLGCAAVTVASSQLPRVSGWR